MPICAHHHPHKITHQSTRSLLGNTNSIATRVTRDFNDFGSTVTQRYRMHLQEVRTFTPLVNLVVHIPPRTSLQVRALATFWDLQRTSCKPASYHQSILNLLLATSIACSITPWPTTPESTCYAPARSHAQRHHLPVAQRAQLSWDHTRDNKVGGTLLGQFKHSPATEAAVCLDTTGPSPSLHARPKTLHQISNRRLCSGYTP